MRSATIALAASVLALASPVLANAGGTPSSARADLVDASGKRVGTVKVRAAGGHGLRITLAVKGLQPGDRGVHLHAVGKCEGPAFTSAGPHWNPEARKHGRDNPDGAHRGDLPNLTVKPGGRGTLEFMLHRAHLLGDGGLLDGDGAAVVIHAKPDDYRTDPSGSSGDRVICGVLQAR